MSSEKLVSSSLSSLISYPAAERNKQPILDVLKEIFLSEFSCTNLEAKLKLLEVGSASGQHITHFAQSFPNCIFQPTDINNELFDSIKGYRTEFKLENISDPLVLDLTWPSTQWPVAQMSQDVIYCSNVLHISPWKCSAGLFEGASRVLKPQTGVLIVYGPFSVDGILSPQSNVDFDASLKSRNPQWGIRDTKQINSLAEKNNFSFVKMFNMPANNKILLFKLLKSIK